MGLTTMRGWRTLTLRGPSFPQWVKAPPGVLDQRRGSSLQKTKVSSSVAEHAHQSCFVLHGKLCSFYARACSMLKQTILEKVAAVPVCAACYTHGALPYAMVSAPQSTKSAVLATIAHLHASHDRTTCNRTAAVYSLHWQYCTNVHLAAALWVVLCCCREGAAEGSAAEGRCSLEEAPDNKASCGCVCRQREGKFGKAETC